MSACDAVVDDRQQPTVGGLAPGLREVSHGAGGGGTRRRYTTSSRRPVIRCTSPERAAGSGSSARRVVLPGPMVTSQSSNCARSTGPAWPVKVISYVRGRTRVTPRGQLSHVRSACQAPAACVITSLTGDPGLWSLASDRAARNPESLQRTWLPAWQGAAGEARGGRGHDECGRFTPAVRADEVPADDAARDAGHEIGAAGPADGGGWPAADRGGGVGGRGQERAAVELGGDTSTWRYFLAVLR